MTHPGPKSRQLESRSMETCRTHCEFPPGRCGRNHADFRKNFYHQKGKAKRNLPDNTQSGEVLGRCRVAFPRQNIHPQSPGSKKEEHVNARRAQVVG